MPLRTRLVVVVAVARHDTGRLNASIGSQQTRISARHVSPQKANMSAQAIHTCHRLKAGTIRIPYAVPAPPAVTLGCRMEYRG
jgi:S-ribosylhomocysteine lyase LuxS involved in autoinducer biosynthesis